MLFRSLAATSANREELLDWARARIASGQLFSSTPGDIHGLMPMTDDNGDILIRLMLHGDVNVDSLLDGDDYFELDRAFLLGLSVGPEADINHDERVDAADYFLLDRAFLTIHATAAQAAAPAPGAPAFLRIASVRDLLDVEDER